MIESEMIHGTLPHSGRVHLRQNRCSIRAIDERDRRSRQRPQVKALTVEVESEGMGEWDVSMRAYRSQELLRGAETGGRGHRRSRVQMKDEVAFVPEVVVATVWEEASAWLGERLPADWVAELAERAQVIFQHNAGFRRLLRRPGEAGQAGLRAFARHWLCALLASRRPDLCSRMPPSYAVGHDLPPA